MFKCFTFFHSKGNTKENIFYDVKNAVDVPIIPVFLVGKRGRVQKEEKGRGEVNKKGDHHPEFLGVIHKEYGWVLDLSIQEYDAVNNDQDCFYRGG